MTDNNPADGVTGPHAHGLPAPVDIGGNSGFAVTAQLDYLPNGIADEVSGGYVIASSIYSYCAQYDINDPYGRYTGKKVQVDILHYDKNGYQINGNSVIYEHVTPNANVSETWFHWNNYNAALRLWATWLNHYFLNNLQNGGVTLGTVAQVSWAPPAGCSTGSHLHQEASSGAYNYHDYWGKSVTAAYSDSQYVTITGINGTAP